MIKILQHLIGRCGGPRADDIGGACGQLVGNVEDATRRSSRYKARSSNSASENPAELSGNLAVSAETIG